MATTVYERENCGNDCSKWQGKIAETTVQNGKEKLWQRPFTKGKIAATTVQNGKGKLRQRLFKMARENCSNDCSKWQGEIAAPISIDKHEADLSIKALFLTVCNNNNNNNNNNKEIYFTSKLIV